MGHCAEPIPASISVFSDAIGCFFVTYRLDMPRYGLRNYKSEELERKVRDAFRQFEYHSVSVDLLTMGPRLRPSNESNLRRLSQDMKDNGFRNGEAVLVWKARTGLSPIVWGSQRVDAARLAGLLEVAAFYTKSDPAHPHPGSSLLVEPTYEDLVDAHGIASLYESTPAPRSIISRLIEIRAIINSFEQDTR